MTEPLTPVSELLFEANLLKKIPRSGFTFLGAGSESVADHSFTTAFIAFVFSRLHPEVDAGRIITMCLLHDLPEARMGDMNYVQKKYVDTHEDTVLDEFSARLPFGGEIREFIEEFNAKKTREARLAYDADQLSLLVELKSLMDTGCRPAEHWIDAVIGRLITESGRQLADTILHTDKDDWWRRLISV